MEREIDFFPRKIDKQTLLDLLCIAIEQTNAELKISEATNSEFTYPLTAELFEMVLDALGVPDKKEYREGLEALFYDSWALENKFKTVHAFYDELIYCVEEYHDVDEALK
ncbi:MAG: hypothetical protein COB35_12685 [Gammaproteobacteria bacterium]|nr:MAG: hypothetical protein COB35_12685 [Gammaproteobacteria bacterium]